MLETGRGAGGLSAWECPQPPAPAGTQLTPSVISRCQTGTAGTVTSLTFTTDWPKTPG